MREQLTQVHHYQDAPIKVGPPLNLRCLALAMESEEDHQDNLHHSIRNHVEANKDSLDILGPFWELSGAPGPFGAHFWQLIFWRLDVQERERQQADLNGRYACLLQVAI